MNIDHLLWGVLFGVLVEASLAVLPLLAGPTLYDRVLAVNSFGTKTVIALSLISFLNHRTDYLDIALLYALINFVATIAILKFFRYRSFTIALGAEASAAERSRSAGRKVGP